MLDYRNEYDGARAVQLVAALYGAPPRSDGVRGLLTASCAVWADKDAGAAVGWMWENGDSIRKEGTLFMNMFEWTKQQPLEALDWIAAKPSGSLQKQLFEYTVRNAAVTDPVGTATFVSELSTRDPDFAVGMVSSIAGPWGRSDPAAALAWVAGVANPTVRETANAEIVRTWAGVDPVGAAEWVNNQPPGAARDKTVAAMVASTGDQFPERAAEWAATIQDNESRSYAFRDVFLRWKETDEAAARQWAANKDFGKWSKE